MELENALLKEIFLKYSKVFLAWSFPFSFKGISICPWNLPSLFQLVSPCLIRNILESPIWFGIFLFRWEVWFKHSIWVLKELSFLEILRIEKEAFSNLIFLKPCLGFPNKNRIKHLRIALCPTTKIFASSLPR